MNLLRSCGSSACTGVLGYFGHLNEEAGSRTEYSVVEHCICDAACVGHTSFSRDSGTDKS